MAISIVWTLALLAAISCPAISAQGQQVSISDAPAIVQVEVKLGNLWIQQCAGVVLTSVHILSAATCFSGVLYLESSRQIRAGTSRRSAGDGATALVGFATNHPNFRVGGHDSDISVVRLRSPFTLGGNIQQAPIIAQGSNLPSGLNVFAYGWGTTAQGVSFSDNNLYRSAMSTQAPCDDKVTNNMMCVGPQSGSARYDARDVGAPVAYDNIVVGLVSFGAGTGSSVVCASVSAFTNWIVANAV